ncbi:MAG TPA: hypothetical protein VGI20_13315 [Rhizomicrobium sp.]|jgi:Na+/proline symporter
MLQLAIELLEWLPRIFGWILPPIVLTLLILPIWRRTRARMALASMIVAAIAGIFLSLETAALAYVCCDQVRVIFSILLDFRPGVTGNFLAALFSGLRAPLLRLVPMLVVGAITGITAFALRARSSGKETSLSDDRARVGSSGAIS